MRKLIIAVFLFVSSLTTNSYADGHGIKMGIILGFTGPIESLTPAMAASAELAFKEASDSGSLLGGKKISVTRADSTCVDSAAAVTAAEGLVSGGAIAIMGADCSGVTGAIAEKVAVPNGVVSNGASSATGKDPAAQWKEKYRLTMSNLLSAAIQSGNDVDFDKIDSYVRKILNAQYDGDEAPF